MTPSHQDIAESLRSPHETLALRATDIHTKRQDGTHDGQRPFRLLETRTRRHSVRQPKTEPTGTCGGHVCRLVSPCLPQYGRRTAARPDTRPVRPVRLP